VHGGHGASAGPLTTPIVQTSTFAFSSAAEMRRYLEGGPELFLYTRYANPTVRDLEESLAALEGAEAALALSSGMAAMTTAVLSVARAGDEVLASASLYGGTVRLLTDFLPRLGIASRFLKVEDLARVGRLAGDRSRLLIVESPTNPTLEIVDLAAACASARERASSSSSTTRSRPRSSSARSPSAPTSSCTA